MNQKKEGFDGSKAVRGYYRITIENYYGFEDRNGAVFCDFWRRRGLGAKHAARQRAG